MLRSATRSVTLARIMRLPVALTILALAACDHGEKATPSPVLPPTTTASASAAPRSGLTLTRRSAAGHRYRIFAPGPRTRLALTTTRPDPAQASVLLAVAGTYTGPDDRVEGLFVVDGELRNAEPKPWEGALLLVDGRPRLLRFPDGVVAPATLTELEARRGSLLQGHLLVHEKAALPLKSSPALQRRAVVTQGGAFAVFESEGPVELAAFAADLVTLGAEAALNLDMGTWSEGWYRRDDGTVAPLGDDHRATARQSNWLIFLQGAS